ncbi:hypothetical protein M011DRAFT_468591 [Sporormia fimetaria CBS 119925]|uniref:Large ribosomal subunit protein uL23m n=1 Tax=Sporormia fimetaria CBS 119925 TaxID=1340428 RepID=A0A6A6VBG4_9PLEO|nr:hypothetical protein M011DRAFT_468591 [Sporormia fimetaria CBS 119925]
MSRLAELPISRQLLEHPSRIKILKFGEKKIYLPRFKVVLIRTPHLSPYHAKFRVPINFTKFDLRDYLYNGYQVRAHSIRSYIKKGTVQNNNQIMHHMLHRQTTSFWYRTEHEKYMTIEMDQPFEWPKEPEDLTPWGGVYNKEADMKKDVWGPGKDVEMRRKDQKELRFQAVELLQGKKKGLKGWEEIRPQKRITADEGEYRIKA